MILGSVQCRNSPAAKFFTAQELHGIHQICVFGKSLQAAPGTFAEVPDLGLPKTQDFDGGALML